MSFDDESTPRSDFVRTLVERRAFENGSSSFLVAARSARRLTYEGLLERVNEWRRLLRSHNVLPGSRVGIQIADPIDFAIAFFAVIVDGSWAAPLDPMTVVTNAEQLNLRVANLRLEVVLSDRVAPAQITTPWIIVPEADFIERLSNATNPVSRGGGIILSSSGTTGTPKIIALGESQLLYAATQIATHNRLSASERGFNPLPLWHINAEVVGLLATLVAGASLVLDDRFHRSDFWSIVDRFEVTWVNAVPAIISRIAALNEGESVPSRLRFVRSASAPLSPALLTSFEANTGVVVIESYGMTEAASQICVNPLYGPRKIGSVGPAIGVELRVAPLEDPSERANGESDVANVGHVEIRGASVITHYDASGYDDRFDAEGWLKTGDLGYLDGDGYLFLVGRSDDVINRGGEKIFPREIEDVVLACADVVAAAVLGAPDDVFGQVPVLYVQLTESVVGDFVSLEEKVGELGALLSASFARARRPIRIVVVESFPSHATGKIQRKTLAAHPGVVHMERDLK